jgi:hypothetical protein
MSRRQLGGDMGGGVRVTEWSCTGCIALVRFDRDFGRLQRGLAHQDSKAVSRIGVPR